MSDTNTPRTDANKHALCEEIELELAELREHVGLCHDAIGECRGSDTSELHKFFDGHMKLMCRLHTAETQRDELRDAVRAYRDAKGRYHTQKACERLLALLPENVASDLSRTRSGSD